jgi:general secretion pathway protein I
MKHRGFTLLEMLVASAIMGIAVVGLLSNLSTSMRNVSRLADYDRAVVLARAKMDELLLDRRLGTLDTAEGSFDAALTGGEPAGWRARVTPFDVPPGARNGTPILQRLELEIWWTSGGHRRTLSLEGYRKGLLGAAGTASEQPQP